MKQNLTTALALVALTATAFSQGGPLTPPAGVPVPTMKSLDLVEPRIPLVAGAPGVFIDASGDITISQPGSYYLTGNLQITGNVHGMVIIASGVSLDLMGHSIIAPASGNAGYAIFVNANANNIRIQNGHILSTTTFGTSFTLGGFFSGIFTSSGRNNVSISNVTVRGSRSTGILVSGQGCIVANCSVFIAGGSGILNENGTVVDSVVHTTGSTGILASVVSNCRVNNAFSTGIDAATVSNSYAQSTSTESNGIQAITVENSVGITSGNHGISATTVSNSRGQSTNTSSGNHGINASSGQVSGSNGVAAGGHGIFAATVSNSRGESTNISIGRDGINAAGGQVSGSSGIASGGNGITAATVSHSVGSSFGANGASSSGILASRVSSSQGTASNASGGPGITGGFSVTASYGTSSGSQGIRSASGTVSDSYGSSSGSTPSSRGIQAQIVTSSHGRSSGTNGGDGIIAQIVKGSYGYAATGARHGIDAFLAESSIGQRGDVGTSKFGLRATRANFCRGYYLEDTTPITSESIITKYNMP